MNSVPIFPLAAVVGADDLKLALCLAAIDPLIGGVLIEGPRGMAKSTLARGLADLLAAGHFVTLPLGATEERLIGTLDLDAALSEGQVRFSAGLLAKAHGGVLYVDEVNLLPDHLVDVLLDVAASGVNYVERDGLSHQHPARFVLIGTMNTEEGELRPQLLDRFGLNIVLEQRPRPEQRVEIIRRRLAFDTDPQGFMQHWAASQEALRQRCQQARTLLPQIPLDDEALNCISQRCFEAAVEGVRADLVWLRAARAHAAWQGRLHIHALDIDAVADFVLRHRQGSPSPEALQPPPSSPPSALSSAKASAAEGQWGALPPQSQPMGERQVPPRWPKKP